MVGCFLTAVSGESVPDLLRCLQFGQSVFVSIVPPRRHHLPQELHDLLLLGDLPLSRYPERTSLLLLPFFVNVRRLNLGTEIASYLPGDNLSPLSRLMSLN